MIFLLGYYSLTDQTPQLSLSIKSNQSNSVMIIIGYNTSDKNSEYVAHWERIHLKSEDTGKTMVDTATAYHHHHHHQSTTIQSLRHKVSSVRVWLILN